MLATLVFVSVVAAFVFAVVESSRNVLLFLILLGSQVLSSHVRQRKRTNEVLLPNNQMEHTMGVRVLPHNIARVSEQSSLE